MNDPTKLAALAALVWITPETHRHLFKNVCQCGSDTFNVMVAGDCDVAYCDECGGRWKDVSRNTLTLPALDTPAGDDVFLAPTMRWCKSKGLEPTVDGEYGPWNAMIKRDGLTEKCAQSPTLALLRACQSAGVPEIVAIFGEGEHA
jgi:hypothetical protein